MYLRCSSSWWYDWNIIILVGRNGLVTPEWLTIASCNDCTCIPLRYSAYCKGSLSQPVMKHIILYSVHITDHLLTINLEWWQHFVCCAIMYVVSPGWSAWTTRNDISRVCPTCNTWFQVNTKLYIEDVLCESDIMHLYSAMLCWINFSPSQPLHITNVLPRQPTGRWSYR